MLSLIKTIMRRLNKVEQRLKEIDERLKELELENNSTSVIGN